MVVLPVVVVMVLPLVVSVVTIGLVVMAVDPATAPTPKMVVLLTVVVMVLLPDVAVEST
jgi:hypothetical protein